MKNTKLEEIYGCICSKNYEECLNKITEFEVETKTNCKRTFKNFNTIKEKTDELRGEITKLVKDNDCERYLGTLYNNFFVTSEENSSIGEKIKNSRIKHASEAFNILAYLDD